MPEISAALLSGTFEQIFQISVDMLEIVHDEILIDAYESLRELAGVTLRVKKGWLRIFGVHRAAVNLEIIVDLYFSIQHVTFYPDTRFIRLCITSLKEMFLYFVANPEVELCMAQTLSLHPHEAITESLKTLGNRQRRLTNELVEDHIDFLARGAVLGNFQNSSLNGVLVFLPPN